MRHWDEDSAAGLHQKQGTVMASLMSAQTRQCYPRQTAGREALARAGRIERTLFIFGLAASVELRRRVQRADKGEARNAGQGKTSSTDWVKSATQFEQLLPGQRPQSGGSATMWNTVYLERATSAALRGNCGTALGDIARLQYLSPAGVGAHQPDRRLPAAQQRQGVRGD